MFADLERQVPGLHFQGDAAAGASDDLPVTYDAERQRLSVLLDHMFEPAGLGYVVQSKDGSPDDGWLLVHAGRERGYAEGLASAGRPGRDDLRTGPGVPQLQGQGDAAARGGGPRRWHPVRADEQGRRTCRGQGGAGQPNRQALEAQTQQFLVHIISSIPTTRCGPAIWRR